MLKNYLTITIRNIRRQWTFTLINVLGLSLGLAGSFVIGSWVWQELNYDKQFANAENIYRVSVSFYNSGAFANGPYILNEILKERAPEVELSTRVSSSSPIEFKVGSATYSEKPFFADSSFFDMFSYDFIYGGEDKPLADPLSAVLGEALAQKVFGRSDVVGESLVVGEEDEVFVIRGVVADPSSPSHLPIQLWLPLAPTPRSNWTGASYHSYVKLAPNVSKDQLIERLEIIKETEVFPTFNTGLAYDEWKNSGYFGFHVVGLTDIHLDPDFRFEFKAGGNRANVRIFFLVSLFLILIACINFINLSTAQAARRAKEVGIRKTMGTSRSVLIYQFLGESVFISLLAMLVSLSLAEIFLIFFQQFLGENLLGGIFDSATKVILYVALALLIGLLSGFYPAFYLSKFKPVEVLKRKPSGQGKSGNLRNGLVILQFMVSTILIICSFQIYRQLDYLSQVDIGLDRSNVLTIENIDVLADGKNAFRQQVLSRSEVYSASFNKRVPAGPSVWVYSFQSKNMPEAQAFQTFVADDQFITTMGLRLVKGRNFERNRLSDSTAIILNRSAVMEMQLEEPVGAAVGGYEVIGVVEDFSYQNYYEKPGPVVMVYDPDGYRLSIKFDGTKSSDMVKFINEAWTATVPDEPIKYSFLDDSFAKLVEKEQTLGKTVGFFTLISIFVACLGLFGLAAFTASQSRREIGIRKVMGARIVDVILLLNRNYTRLVIISTLFSVPLAYYFLRSWLSNFVYKTDLGIWLFASGAMISLVVAWLTVGVLSFRAAVVNPTETLREE